MSSDPSPDRCDRIVNNGMGEPTECGRTLPCDLHSEPTPDTGLTAETLARELEQEFLLNVDPTGLTPHWWQERADAILARLSEPTP